MSDDYIRTKIKEALAASEGNKQAAQKLLIAWAVRDQPLLLGLTKPHLKAIVTARIENAVHATKKSGDSGAGDDHFSKKSIDQMIASKPLGEKRSSVVPPPKSSMRQATVMHQLVAAFKKKKK